MEGKVVHSPSDIQAVSVSQSSPSESQKALFSQALENKDEKNLFLGIHSSSPFILGTDLQKLGYDIKNINTFITKVPKNTYICKFTPNDYICADDI